MKTEKFKLGIIDEDEGDVREFRRFFEDEFEIAVIELVDNKHQIIRNIIDEQVDAVVIDYRLMERGDSPVTFNGHELYKELTLNLYNFPAFIMTQYAPDARNHRIDPFRIIPKAYMQPDESKPNYQKGQDLIAIINTLIRNYKESLEEAEEKLLLLLEKKEKKGKLTDFEEEEIIDLDTFLEKSLSQKARLPKKWKRKEERSKLDELVKGTQEILNQLKRKKDERISK